LSKSATNVIKVGDKEIELNTALYKIIHEHYRTGGTLDSLGEAVGLTGWDSAYQLVASMPQWVLWFTQTQFEEHLKALSKARPEGHHPHRRRKGAEDSSAQAVTPEDQPGEKAKSEPVAGAEAGTAAANLASEQDKSAGSAPAS
jgi:hypothetical protein